MPNLPIVGNVGKGPIIIGGLAAAGVAGYIVLRKKKTAPGAVATAYGYGASAYGYGAYDEPQGYYGYGASAYGGSGNVIPEPVGEEYGYGAYGYGDYNPYTGQYLGGGTGTGVVTPPPPLTTSPTTNLQWVTQANSALGGGKRTPLLSYIGGLHLSANGARTVREAIGLMGEPPVPAASGYPPKWHSGEAGGGSGQSGTHTVTANGKQSLNAIAKANGISWAKIASLNPNLKRYFGTGKALPHGTSVKV
jgi:hypothetical protein